METLPNGLTEKQNQLYEYMSDLSEEAYSAGWMNCLEYYLWKAVNGQIKEFGRLTFTNEIIGKLKRLSSDINGWIIYNEEGQETYIEINEWINHLESLK